MNAWRPGGVTRWTMTGNLDTVSSVAGEEDIDVSGEIFNFSGPTVGGAVGSNSGPETRGREGWDEISEAVQHNN